MAILHLGGLKLQIYEDALSKTLKSCKFDLGVGDKTVFLVDLYGMGLDLCQRASILAHVAFMAPTCTKKGEDYLSYN